MTVLNLQDAMTRNLEFLFSSVIMGCIIVVFKLLTNYCNKIDQWFSKHSESVSDVEWYEDVLLQDRHNDEAWTKVLPDDTSIEYWMYFNRKYYNHNNPTKVKLLKTAMVLYEWLQSTGCAL